MGEPSQSEIEAVSWATPLSLPPVREWTVDTMDMLMRRLLLISFHPPDLIQVSGIKTGDVTGMVRRCRELLSREDTVVQVPVPVEGRVHVFGDLHGHFHDLANGLKEVGWPENNRNIIVFDGDFVDRGSWSIECMILLVALKLWKPMSVYLLRGNHETKGCVTRYGFEIETRRKYGEALFKGYVSLFRELPAAALVILAPMPSTKGPGSQPTPPRPGRKESKGAQCLGLGRLGPGEQRIFVAHGGLFRKRDRSGKVMGSTIGTLEDLSALKRNEEDPVNSILEDVIWSDPQIEANDVALNVLRGAGILYGQGAVENFLLTNHLTGIIRGHEGPDMRERRPGMGDMLQGFSWDMEFSSGKFLLTLFSARDYALTGVSEYPMDQPRANKAAFATIRGRNDPRAPTTSSSLLPSITSLPPPRKPEHYDLYYDSCLETQAATPRA